MVSGNTRGFPDYPFDPKRIDIRPGIALSYLDEGPRDGEVLVMLHGNPSWSYYWRHLVLGLRDRYRCIVPDHVGMGLSDKPDDAAYRYTLQSRVDDLDTLLGKLVTTAAPKDREVEAERARTRAAKRFAAA